MVLSVALNYGGRAEIVDACRAAMRKLFSDGKSPEDLTEEGIARELYTSNLAELDLLVRTSGELRISNFLLFLAERLRRNSCHGNTLAGFSPECTFCSRRSSTINGAAAALVG